MTRAILDNGVTGIADGTPPCEAQLRQENWRLCGEPSACRIRSTCAPCGQVYAGFLCGRCRDAMLRDRAGCTRCGSGPVRLAEFW
jgi:hypothetical protein